MVGAGQYQSGVKAISGQGQRRGKAEAGQRQGRMAEPNPNIKNKDGE